MYIWCVEMDNNYKGIAENWSRNKPSRWVSLNSMIYILSCFQQWTHIHFNMAFDYSRGKLLCWIDPGLFRNKVLNHNYSTPKIDSYSTKCVHASHHMVIVDIISHLIIKNWAFKSIWYDRKTYWIDFYGPNFVKYYPHIWSHHITN